MELIRYDFVMVFRGSDRDYCVGINMGGFKWFAFAEIDCTEKDEAPAPKIEMYTRRTFTCNHCLFLKKALFSAFDRVKCR